MRPGPKLAAFAAVVIAVFGFAAAVGAAVGPIDVGGDTPMQHQSPTHQEGP